MSAPLWWQSGVIYQVYPRSFQDTNGDGVGDLPGILLRLDYLADLGVDALWLSPVNTSPMADFGYDVADYTGIDPLFGTLTDFDALVAGAHARGLKLLMDFVPNHSSDRHPWFKESRSSRQSPKRDWYIWRDPAPDGGPPNNWQSYFGGSAWDWDEPSAQYYLHLFLKEQPDLNWRNPELRAAMLDAMRFWFARGVDGFRLDVLWHAIKDERLRDNPPNPEWRAGMQDIDRQLPIYSGDRPEMAEIVSAMRDVADEFHQRVLVGEIYLPLDQLVAYYGADERGIHLPFNFHLLQTPWRADAIRKLIADYEALLPDGAWPNWVLGNHDKPRIASRVGEAEARVAAMLLLTLRGTPTLYQGDELGLANQLIPPDRVRDPQALREPDTAFNRDAVRTPMPWDGSLQAAFSTAEPWLPLNADWRTRNVASQAADEGSMLALHRRLLALRRAHPALRAGRIELLPEAGEVLAYARVSGEERIVVVLSLSGVTQDWELPQNSKLLLSTCPRERGDPASSPAFESSGVLTSAGTRVRLAPDEGLVLLAESTS